MTLIFLLAAQFTALAICSVVIASTMYRGSAFHQRFKASLAILFYERNAHTLRKYTQVTDTRAR